jgi:hypothetical protein
MSQITWWCVIAGGNSKRSSIYATDPVVIFKLTADKEIPFNMRETKCTPILMNDFIHYRRRFEQRQSSWIKHILVNQSRPEVRSHDFLATITIMDVLWRHNRLNISRFGFKLCSTSNIKFIDNHLVIID